MVCRLSMMNLLCACFFAAAHAPGAGLGVNVVRGAGDALDTSLRNEADHAVRQGIAWLISRQNADGFWGTSNRVHLTALALCAVKGSGLPAAQDPWVNATLWLNANAATAPADLWTHAWRLLAFSLTIPASPGRDDLFSRLKESAAACRAAAPEDAQAFWREVAASFEPAPPAAPADATSAAEKARLAAVAAAWPPALADNAAAWALARLVNRAGSGHLAKEGHPLDWRTALARRLVNTQRRAPDAGGYWEAADDDGRIAETALGILTLLEL